MSQSRLGSVFLNLTLIVCGLLLLVLAYGFVTRAFVPRANPSVDIEGPAVRSGEEVAEVPGEVGGIPIQVEVRNAAGVADLARVTTLYLREHGFDVIEVGNASQRDSSSIVILNGTTDHAMRVATALSISSNHFEEGARRDYDPDVAVHIGSDYLSLTPFEEADSTDSIH